MQPVYVISDNIYSPLGADTAANYEAVKHGLSGIRKVENKSLATDAFYASSFVGFPAIEISADMSPFEQLCIASITEAISGTDISLADSQTVFILSSTKGNIGLLANSEITEATRKRLSLSTTANVIAGHFHAVNQALVVSSACISGVSAILLAHQLLASGQYQNAVVTGCDILSSFIVSGFQSLSAMSADPCMPFDRDRTGITLGECAATIVLSVNKPSTNSIQVHAGAITNDANHISGPSRTGAELSQAIGIAMSHSGVGVDDISCISAHGTATLYNDEMEAKAFNLAGISHVPTFSLKANFGHTLGAAGVLESILTYRSLREGVILPSKNFKHPGTSLPVNINTELKASNKQYALKTASGFGGCNAAIIYSKN